MSGMLFGDAGIRAELAGVVAERVTTLFGDAVAALDALTAAAAELGEMGPDGAFACQDTGLVDRAAVELVAAAARAAMALAAAAATDAE